MSSSSGGPRRARDRALLTVQALVLVGALTAAFWPDGPPPAVAVSAGSQTPATDNAVPDAVDLPTEAPTTAPAAPLPAPPPPEPEITLAFGGDVHFERGIARALARDPASMFGDAAAPLLTADVAMVNLESSVGPGGTAAPGKQYVFRAPSTAFAGLKTAGVDLVSMANNHALDYGRQALVNAVDAGTVAGVPVIGAGRDVDEAFRPWVTTVKGQRVSVIAATQVLDSSLAKSWTATARQAGMASAKDPERLLRAVREARAAGGVVAVYLHWGRELEPCPPPNARELASQLVDAGADIIVGTHAHIRLPDGYLGGAYVHYGLGNLLWYTGDTHKGGVVTLTVKGRTVTDASYLPIRMAGSTPVQARDSGVTAEALRCAGLASAPS